MEAPETAGTALKTVIARFSEVKKLYSEGQLTGQDEEGEEISVNKVAAALKTAGIEMNEYFTGAKGLDEIFMELAERWDSLDLVQQRYIATMAAGSRQQSRFIALMSDYGRTMELVEGAQNATGASAGQFEKTQESLQSKLARLKDTWQEFSMGLANNQMIKGAVDALTGLLNILNKITESGTQTGSTIKKLIVMIGGFKLAKGAVNKGLMAVGGSLGQRMGFGEQEGSTQPKTFLGRMSERSRNFVAANPKGAGKDRGGFAAFRTDAELERYNKNKLAKKNERRSFFGKQEKSEIKKAGNAAEIEAENQAKEKSIAINQQSAQAEAVDAAAKQQNTNATQEQNSAIEGALGAKGAEESVNAANAASEKAIAGAKAEETMTEQQQAAAIGENVAMKGTEEGANMSLLASEEAMVATDALLEAGVISETQAEAAALAMTEAGIGVNTTAQATEEARAGAQALVAAGLISQEEAQTAANIITEAGVGSNTALAASETAVGTSAAGTVPGITAMGTALWTSLAPILPIILAVGAGIGAIVGIVKGIEYAQEHTQKAIDQNSLNNATESLKQYEEEAQNAQNRVEDLESAWEELTNSNNDLENLIPGTMAFEQAIYKTNQQVLDLIDNYKELAQYVNLDSNTGLLSISEEGYQQILQQQNEKLRQAQSRQMYVQTMETASKAKVEYNSDLEQGFSNYISDSFVSGKDKDLQYYQLSDAIFGDGYISGGQKRIPNVDDSASLSRLKFRNGQWQWTNENNTNSKEATTEEINKINEYLTSTEALTNPNTSISTFANSYQRANNSYKASMLLANKQAVMQMQNNGTIKGLDSDVYSAVNNILMQEDQFDYSKLRKKSGSIYDVLQVDDDHYSANKTTGGVTKLGKQASNWLIDNPEYLKALGLDEKEISGMSNMDLYAKMKGWTYHNVFGSNNYFTDENGETITVGTSGKDRTKEQIERDLANMIMAGSGGEKYDNFVRAVQKDENLKKLANSDYTTDIGELQEKLNGLNSQQEKDLSEENKAIKNYLNNNLKNFEDTRRKKIAEYQKKNSNLFSGNNIATVADYENAEKIREVAVAYEGLGDNTSSFLEGVLLGSNNIEELTESSEKLLGLSEKLNFNSPIQSAKILNEEIKKGGEYAEAAQQVLNADAIGENKFSFGSQIKELINSEEFKDIKKQLDEIYQAEGKISSDNIRDLATKGSLLDTVMQNTGASSAAMAAIMEDLSEGTLNATELTNDLAEAYKTLYNSVDKAGDVIKRLESYQIGDSDTKIGNIYATGYNAVKELMDRGAYGDSQIDDYMNQMLGEDTWQSLLDAAGGNKAQAFENANQQYYLSANNGNMRGSLAALVNQNQGNLNGLLSVGANGSIDYDLTGINSSEEFYNKLAESLNISREMAEAYAADMGTYSKTLNSDLQSLDLKVGSAQFRKGRTVGKDEEGKYLLNASDAELKRFAKANGQSLEDYKKGLEGKGYKFVNREYSENGLYYKNKDGSDNNAHLNDTAKEKAWNTIRANNADKAQKNENGQPTKPAWVGDRNAETDEGKLKLNVELKNKDGTLNKETLDKILAVDEIRDILVNVESDTDKRQLLEEMGLSEGLIDQLLEPEAIEAAKTQSEAYAADLYNKIGQTFTAIAELLKSSTLTIPWSLDVNEASGLLPEALKKLFGTVGGDFKLGGASASYTGFTPKAVDYSGGLSNPDDTGDDGSGKGKKGKSYPKGNDPTNNPGNTGRGSGGGGGGGGDSEDEGPYKTEEAIEKENSQARLNTLKSEEADIDRELNLLQKLPIRLYPLELAMQGRKLANLKKQITAQKEVVKQSEAELANLRKKNSQLDKYYTIEEKKDDFGNTQRTFQYTDEYKNASDEEKKKADEGGLDDIKSATDDANSETDALNDLMGDFGGQALDMLNSGIDMAKQAIEKMVEVFSALVDWWTSREDWLYNLLSKIEQETRNFARLQQVEERFRLGSTEGVDELVAAWYAQKESLDKQIALEEELIASRKAELQFLNLQNALFSPAFHYDYKEERVIENPWVYDIYKLVFKMGSLVPEIGGVFSSLESWMENNKERMEKAVQEIEDAKDKILEIEKQQLELRQQYMDDEVSLEELVMGKIIEKMQEEIDSMTALSEAISEANSKLLETLQNNLEKMRQDRENANTEEELAKKERRLAYLRQDTSGANQVEIRKLEEELDKGHQDYTDKLIDQKITELQKQNDKAAAQREAQINLAQAQLDYTERYGLQWEEARELIKNGYDDQGRLRVGSELFDLLMSSEDFAGLGAGSTRQLSQRMEWDITGIASATFRAINDVWNKGFLLNNPQSANVHKEEQKPDYKHLPQYLNFLQPAYEALQDYFVNWTGKNIEAFFHQLGDEETSPLALRKFIGMGKRFFANWDRDTSTQSNRGNINYATTTTPDLFKANNYGNKTTQNTISNKTYQNNIVNYNNFNTNVGNNWDRAGIVTVMRDVLGEWADGFMSLLNPFDNSRSH